MAWLEGLPVSWPLLSDVGQAYGGASALLSGLAFCGIAASLLLQWRQHRLSLLYSVKQRHFELVKLALENPEYLYVDGLEVAADPDARLKVYGNLLVNHWSMTWDMGFMGEAALRESGRRLFLSELARTWWLRWGSSYLGAPGRERFVRILDEEAVSAEGSASTHKWASSPTVGTAPGGHDPGRVGLALVAFGLGFAAARSALARRTRADQAGARRCRNS